MVGGDAARQERIHPRRNAGATTPATSDIKMRDSDSLRFSPFYCRKIKIIHVGHVVVV